MPKAHSFIQCLTPEELKEQLGCFTGSEEFLRHWSSRTTRYTEGVMFLADQAGAHWLIDLVASYQKEPKVAVEDFQVWTLEVRDNKGAVRMTDGDSKKAIVSQEIHYTDFPLDEIKVWAVRNELGGVTLLLPSEY